MRYGSYLIHYDGSNASGFSLGNHYILSINVVVFKIPASNNVHCFTQMYMYTIIHVYIISKAWVVNDEVTIWKGKSLTSIAQAKVVRCLVEICR